MLMVNGNPDTRNQEHGVSSEMFQLRLTRHSLAIDGVLYPGHYITTTAVEYDLAIPNSVATYNCQREKYGGNMKKKWWKCQQSLTGYLTRSRNIESWENQLSSLTANGSDSHCVVPFSSQILCDCE